MKNSIERPPPLRVALNALTLPPNLAGVGFYTLKLAEALAALDGIESLTLFTNAASAAAIAALPALPAKVGVVGLPAGTVTRKVLASQFALPRRLHGFHLLHSVGNVACLRTRLPQVVTVHDLCHRVLPGRFTWTKRAYLEWGFRRTCARDVRILCVSENTLRDLVRHYPAAAGKSVAVHSACKFPVSENAGARREGFLFVGTLEPGKNLPLALKALAGLIRSGVTAKLRVVGAKGWKQSHLPALIAELGLGPHVEFLGYLSDDGLRALYRSSEALVFPSAYEGFGFPILEAQSQGCPVLSADNSCLREIGGDGALYFQDGDAEGLEALLGRCRRDPATLADLPARGYANCPRFSWETTAKRTLDVYRSALR